MKNLVSVTWFSCGAEQLRAIQV